MRLQSFAGVTIEGFSQDNSIPVKVRDTLVVLRDGSFDPDGDLSHFEPFEVSFKGLISASVDTTLDNLLRQMGRRGVLKAEMRDGSNRQTWAKLINVERDADLQWAAVQPVQLRFKVDYPFWLLTTDVGWSWGDGSLWADVATGWGQLVASANLTTTSTAFNIDTSPGTVAIRRGKITVKPNAASSCTNLRVTNGRNGHYFEWNSSLAANDTLIIDLLIASVTKNGAAAYSPLFWPSNQADLMRLEVDDVVGSAVNPITVTLGSVTGTVVFKWQYARHFV